MLGSTVLKLDVEVSGDSYKTPFDFEISRLKVKVTVTFIITLESTVFNLDVEVGGDSYNIPIDFEVSRSNFKVTVTFFIKILSDQ